MPGIWTSEKILSLAPDAASAAAGKGLASARKWVSLGRSERAIWGECQGSGAKPYQTRIDLSEPAFKCTCPSRKFPCKHGIGLFLLADAQPGAFKDGGEPAWVTEWLASRAERGEKKAKKVGDAAATPVDPAAAARRAAERRKKVLGGIDELELWLKDLVRHGLAAAQGKPYAFWEGIAARMVDAQAPGLGRMLRESAGIAATGGAWAERLLERVGTMYLAAEGFRRIEALPLEAAADLREAIGFTQRQEEVLAAGTAVTDRWLVLGQRVEEEERLRVQRTWLWGGESGRAALVLAFAHHSQMLETTLVPGAVVEADLVFYPGAWPLRALIAERRGMAAEIKGEWPAALGFGSIGAAISAYSAAVAKSPWIERFPLALRGVVSVRREGQWRIVDEGGDELRVMPGYGKGWELLAVSGGSGVGVFGEWDGRNLLPLGVQAGGRFVGF